MIKIELSVQDTSFLKGIALILLLIHHLFYSENGPYEDVVLPNGLHIVNTFSYGFAKVCVALFVFLSGYGLTKSSKYFSTDIKLNELLWFYRRRIIKLMLNFWLIWILFVPIGILFFHRTFPDVYGHHYVIKAIIDFFGMAFAFGYYGYNATWWFYSCIIVLYLIFPFLYKVRNNIMLTTLIAITLLLVGIHIPILKACIPYHLSFILGIIVASHNSLINNKLLIIGGGYWYYHNWHIAD